MGRIIKDFNPENPYSVEWQKCEKEWEESRRQELIRDGHIPQWDEHGSSTHPDKDKDFYGDCDHPSTIENGTATILWIVAVFVSLFFKGGWVLCVLETVAWWKHITRHNK